MPLLSRGRFALGVCLALAFALSAAAQTKPAVDPFAKEFEFKGDAPAPRAAKQKPEPVTPNFDDPFNLNKGGKTVEERIDFEVKTTPEKVRRGETFKLELIGTPRPGYYTYPLLKLGPKQPEGQLAKITFGSLPGVQPLYPARETEPQPEDIPGEGVHYKHKKTFTWTYDVAVLPEATPGKKTLPITIHLQVCDQTCITGDLHPEAKFEVSDAQPLSLSDELKKRLEVKEESPAAASEAKADGIGAFMLQGLFWGLVSLFTPCVFPMIPITVSFFLKQAEKEGHRPFTMAAVYSLTIVVVLTVSGVTLIPILQPFSQHWITNGFLGVLFLVFALSLLGMFEIRLPSGLANMTQAREGKGGLVGVIFMALTFTIISFTCVAPFYGSFIAFTAAAQTTTDWIKITLGSLSFSTAFAGPFFLLALFPTLLKAMPKSGGWMNTVKAVMGFLEVAAAVKFLRASEIGFFSKADLLTYDLCLGLYVGISLVCSLYLLNLYRLPHDEEEMLQLGVPRLLVGMLFLSLAFYLLPGLFKQSEQEKQRPNGAVFAWLDSFLLPDFGHTLPWIGGLPKGLEVARDQGKRVFIDFTGQL